MNTATGFEAIAILTMAQHGETPRVVEHNAGIDVDNAGRGYDNEYVTDYENVMWSTLLYVGGLADMKDGYTPDDLFSVEYEQGELNGNTDTRVRWFHIHEDIYDGESRGTHFEFLYATTEWAEASEVYSGMEVDISWSEDGEYNWFTVESKWREPEMVIMQDAEGGIIARDPEERVRVRTWR